MIRRAEIPGRAEYEQHERWSVRHQGVVDVMKDWVHFLLLGVCIVVVIVFVALTLFKVPTTFEVVLFQLLILVTGLLGSYIFGRTSAHASALELIKPHARSAFRRVTTLYSSLYRLSERIEELNEGDHDNRLELIQALVNEQITTGQDAMEDWRDIVPEEVEQIERRNAKQ